MAYWLIIFYLYPTRPCILKSIDEIVIVIFISVLKQTSLSSANGQMSSLYQQTDGYSRV